MTEFVPSIRGLPSRAARRRSDPFRVFRGHTALFNALLFTAFVLAVPWDRIAIGVYVDFEVYAQMFHPAEDTVREMYEPDGIVDWFTRELLWQDMMTTLVAWLGEPERALVLVSAFCLFVHSLVLFRRHSALLSWVLLLNPLFLVFGLAQLRLAFATSLLLIAVESRWRPMRIALAGAALFVHSAVPVFLVLYGVVKWVESRGSDIGWRPLLMVCGTVVLSFVVLLSSGRDVLLTAIGDRRAGTYDVVNPESLRVITVWVVFLGLQIASGLEYLRKPDNLYAALLIALFVGLTLLGTYGSRFVAAGFIVVVAAGLNLREDLRRLLIPVFIAYQVVQYYYFLGFHLGG